MPFALWRGFKILQFFLFSTLLMTLVRAESIFWNFSQFQSQKSSDLWHALLLGVRFDGAANAWLLIPLLGWSFWPWRSGQIKIWQRGAMLVAVLSFVPFLIFNLIDIELVNFVGRRLSGEVLFLLGEANGKAHGFLKTFWGLFLIAGATVALQIYGSWAIFSYPAHALPERTMSKQKAGMIFFISFVIWILVARSGWQNKPLGFVDALRFDSSSLNNLVLNTSFNIIKNWSKEPLPRVRYFENRQQMLSHLNGTPGGSSVVIKEFRESPPNVVILMMESFGLEYTGLVQGQTSWTPFLDSLAQKSLSFEWGIANGRRSIEGVAAVLSGIPALMNEPFISSPFSANQFWGLGTRLAVHGYDTAFFHGGKNGTMHFDAFAQRAGLKKYFGANEYPDPRDNDGVWGIYDGPFMSWTVDQLSQMKPPFMAAFFSISSHQPYLIPPAENARFKEGPLPILKAVTYADDSLRKFFEKAEKQSWFKNTIFILTADHTSLPVSEAWNHDLGRWRVPLIFYWPQGHWPEGLDTHSPAQQIDILPSVLDLLGFSPKEEILLGRSLFKPGERTAVTYSDGQYLLISKKHLLRQRPGQGPQLYDLSDAFMKKALDEASIQKRLEDRLKATIQYFSEGLWDNRLYVPVAR